MSVISDEAPQHARRLTRSLVAGLVLLLAASAAAGTDARGPATPGASNADQAGSEEDQSPESERYFAYLKRLDPEQLQQLKLDLRAVIDRCARCVDFDCPWGREVLSQVFSSRRRELPDLILYMRRDRNGLWSSQPVLQWEGKNTPHLFGASNVWILVFAEEKLPLEAERVTIYQQTVNPFAGLLSVIGVSAGTGQDKATDATKAEFFWAPLDAAGPPSLYLGIARLPIGTDSVNFVTVGLKEPKVQKSVPWLHGSGTVSTASRRAQGADAQGAAGPGEAAPQRTAASCPPAGEGETASQTPPAESETLSSVKLQPANAASAHFSNSGDSWTAFSVGFAQTLGVEDTALGQGASSHFNGYAMAKVYVRRPRIRAFQPEGVIERRSRMSLGFVLGTNLQDDPFDEFVVGFSVGNILGKSGLMVGANYTPFLEKKEGETVVRFEREWRLIWGVEYSF